MGGPATNSSSTMAVPSPQYAMAVPSPQWLPSPPVQGQLASAPQTQRTQPSPSPQPCYGELSVPRRDKALDIVDPATGSRFDASSSTTPRSHTSSRHGSFSSSSGSGSGEFVVPSPGLPRMPPTLNAPPNMILRQHQHALLFGTPSSGAMPCPPATAPEADMSALADSLRREAEARIEAATRQYKAECDARVRLDRVRVAELEEKVKRVEDERDNYYSKLTVFEVQAAEAAQAFEERIQQVEERARSEAEKRIRAIQEELVRTKAGMQSAKSSDEAVLPSPSDSEYCTDSRSTSDTEE